MRDRCQACVIGAFADINLETQIVAKGIKPKKYSDSNNTSLTPLASQLLWLAHRMTKSNML